LLNGFGLITSMFLACFSGSSEYTVTVGSQKLVLGKLLLETSSNEEAFLHLTFLCMFFFTAYSVPGLQFCAPSRLLVLVVLSSLDN